MELKPGDPAEQVKYLEAEIDKVSQYFLKCWPERIVNDGACGTAVAAIAELREDLRQKALLLDEFEEMLKHDGEDLERARAFVKKHALGFVGECIYCLIMEHAEKWRDALSAIMRVFAHGAAGDGQARVEADCKEMYRIAAEATSIK